MIMNEQDVATWLILTDPPPHDSGALQYWASAMTVGSLESHTVRGLTRRNVTIDTHAHLAARPSNIGLQSLDP
jgi:hypothetical protein